MSINLNEFLIDRQTKKEQENQVLEVKKKEHLEYVKSLFRLVKGYLKDTEEQGLVTMAVMKRARSAKELAGFVTQFSNETIHFVPMRIDYENNEQIKIVIKNNNYDLIDNVYLFVSQGEWNLFDNRPNRLINTQLDKENFRSLLISLLEK
ncbi:hypothetical protein [Bacillus wiedmannii]|uniref:hypothetical protein n=1 Tax=Bacillus wiedmannii TaxID=1890302 RepID=UPI000BF147A6|nr:hypothetical protein [Bacillus wiedmannii]PEM33759.1 hypothetical protein CN598_04455 [Bacillus wiedmannii]